MKKSIGNFPDFFSRKYSGKFFGKFGGKKIGNNPEIFPVFSSKFCEQFIINFCKKNYN